jgi:hypothetical protein
MRDAHEQGTPYVREWPFARDPQGPPVAPGTTLSIFDDQGLVDALTPMDGLTLRLAGGESWIVARREDTSGWPSGEFTWHLLVEDVLGKILLEAEGLLVVAGSVAARRRAVRPWDFLNPNVRFATPMTAKARLDACRACDRLTNLMTCRECGCLMPAKVKLAEAFCPLDKWGAE